MIARHKNFHYNKRPKNNTLYNKQNSIELHVYKVENVQTLKYKRHANTPNVKLVA
jgi:hypothetical protein